MLLPGISFERLNGLQGPLSSLNVAAHVIYRVARVRVFMNTAAFAETASETGEQMEKLRPELQLLQSEYFSLLYGASLLGASALGIAGQASCKLCTPPGLVICVTCDCCPPC